VSLDHGLIGPQKGAGQPAERHPMTSSRLFKAFALLSLLCASAAAWYWHATGQSPGHGLMRIAAASFLAALVTAIVNPDTRPRTMLRFLAALFALFALIAFAADVSRSPLDGGSLGATSLMQHLQMLAPSFVVTLERSIGHSISPFLWDPVLTTILSLPAWVVFAFFAAAAGYLGRPRRRVRIFANDY